MCWPHMEKTWTNKCLRHRATRWTNLNRLLFRFQCGNVTIYYLLSPFRQNDTTWTLRVVDIAGFFERIPRGLAPQSRQTLTDNGSYHFIISLVGLILMISQMLYLTKTAPKWWFNYAQLMFKPGSKTLESWTLTGSRPRDIMSKLCMPIAALHCQAYPWLSHLWRAALPRESSSRWPLLCVNRGWLLTFFFGYRLKYKSWPYCLGGSKEW